MSEKSLAPPTVFRKPPQQLRRAYLEGYASGEFFVHEVEAYAREERADFLDGVSARELDAETWPGAEGWLA